MSFPFCVIGNPLFQPSEETGSPIKSFGDDNLFLQESHVNDNSIRKRKVYMKIITLLGDGMSDVRYEELGNRSPLEAACTPNMDFMARHGYAGMARTVPKGLPPGSDVANLSIFGYDPRECYTGRSPLEAISMGVVLGSDDVAFRMNLVTLKPGGSKICMQDFSAGHISTDEGKVLVEMLQRELGTSEFVVLPGSGIPSPHGLARTEKRP